MKLSDFDYNLPEELIAQCPTPQRQDSRLLVWRDEIEHRNFSDLGAFLPEGTVLILNDTKVIAGRLYGKLDSGGRVEVFLIQPSQEDGEWVALARPLKKLKPGKRLQFDDQLEAVVLEKLSGSDGGQYALLRFNLGGNDLMQWLEEHGHIPLPPYIKRTEPKPSPEDRQRYQTVYAREQGSVAAPTAGLHFTDEILASLRNQGVIVESVCLHVGAGTFMPVKSENLDEHHMHAESYMVPLPTLKEVSRAKAEGRPVVVVGTTSFRSLESLLIKAEGDWDQAEALCDTWQQTELFIRPSIDRLRYKPMAADALITNFHQPKSTLFMLICALVGIEKAKWLYETAIGERYRFFSYGDSTLLWF